MKRNILCGIMLIGALALGSCSTQQKLASNQSTSDDDVYFSNAKAGDAPAPVYVNNNQYDAPSQDRYNDYNDDDDYYYYDSYASRINRFGYLSPFGYYDDIYYGYGPGYYSPYSSFYYSPYYSGLGFGLGFGLGYGYGYPYGGFGYGYSPYYGYNYYGIGYPYGGGGGYWGGYSAYRNSGTARPYRAMVPRSLTATNRSTGRIGYNGAYPNTYMTRPARTNTNSGYTQGNRTYNTSRSGNSYSRPTRPADNNARPTYQPQVERSYSPPPSNSGSSSSSGGGRSSGGGAGSSGGGRPARP